MANNVVNKSINIFIQSGEAQKAFDVLIKKETQLRDELVKATDTKVVNRLNKEIDALQEPIDRASKKLSGELSPSFKDVQKTASSLGAQLKRMSKDDADYSTVLKQYGEANVLLKEQKKQIDALGSAKKENIKQEHSGGFLGIFERVAEFTAAYELIQKAKEGLKELFVGSIEEADQAQEAVDGLRISLENAGRSDLLDGLLQSADDLASKFKRLDNDDITGVFTKLVDYGKLSEKQIKELTPVIIDYAAKQKVSLGEATDVVTKALEGSAKGLKIYGINLTETKTVSERYGVIVDQLGKKVKGAELAFEETNQGVLQTFKQRVRDAQEAIGKFLYSLTGIEEQAHRNAVAARNEANSANALVSEYEQLTKKTKLTSDEKERLKVIQGELVNIFGTSVLQINKETGAYQLNISATKDLIKQKLLLANKDAADIASKYNALIEEETDLNAKRKAQIDLVTAAQRNAGKSYKEVSDLQFSGGSGARSVADNPLLRNLFDLGVGLDNTNRSIDKSVEKRKELETQLNEHGFKVTDVNKLFNPEPPKDPNAVIGGGDPNANPQGDKTAKTKFDEQLRKAQEFDKKIRDLQQQSQDASLTTDAKEIADAKHKYDEILLAYTQLKKELDKSHISLAFSDEDIKKLENNEIAGLLKKQAEKIAKDQQATVESEYKEALQQSALYFENLKQQRAEDFVAGKIDEVQYKAGIAAIDVAASANLIQIAKDYAGQKITIDGKQVALVKQADDDLTKFKKQNLEKQTADQLAAFAKREANRKLFEDFEKQSQLSHAQALVSLAPAGSSQQEDAQLNLLKLQHDAQVKELREKSSELLKSFEGDSEKQKQINDATNQAIADADAAFIQNQGEIKKQALLKTVQDWIGTTQQLASFADILANAQTQKENAELERDKKLNDKKKANLDKRLKSGSISQQQYDRELEKIQKAQEKREHEVAVKQFKRNQKMQMVQALMNGALAVTNILATVPKFDFGVISAIQVGLAIATTAAEIATIARQKPPELARGGKLVGPSHSDNNGMPVTNPRTGEVQAYVEGGEAILSKNVLADSNVYEAKGTPSQIASLLNSMHGGVSWHAGATIKPLWSMAKPTPMNFPAIRQAVRYAQGGVFQAPSSNQAKASDLDIKGTLETLAIAVVRLQQSNEQLSSTLNTIQQYGISAVVPLGSIEDAQKRKAAILDDATIK